MRNVFSPAPARPATALRARPSRISQAIGGGFAIAVAAFAGCSSKPVIPESKNVKVARENPKDSCREIGAVQGSVSTARGTIEQALEDMRMDAARKGANYVRMESTSAIGTSVSGTAYDCP